MKIKILLAFLFFALLSQAQTKVIAHKSHSGSKNSFAKAYQDNLFDINYSNFGLSKINIRRLDTIIAVNNSITILKYRQSKNEYYLGTKYEELKKSDFIHKIDTMINNHLLNKKNTIKFIKNSTPVLFDTPIDKVVFIGFKKK